MMVLPMTAQLASILLIQLTSMELTRQTAMMALAQLTPLTRQVSMALRNPTLAQAAVSIALRNPTLAQAAVRSSPMSLRPGLHCAPPASHWEG